MAVLQGTIAFAKASYGAIWNMWPFMRDESVSTVKISAQIPDNMICVGTLKGKGTVFRGTLTGATLIYTATSTTIMTEGKDVTGIVNISAPTGGMGQFKGLTQNSVEDLYVQTICRGVAPMYYST
jgi:hypothetical protein